MLWRYRELGFHPTISYYGVHNSSIKRTQRCNSKWIQETGNSKVINHPYLIIIPLEFQRDVN
jgi:hypothetical protein